MYKCQDCGHLFKKLSPSTEKHGLDTPPFEIYGKCPVCHSGFIIEVKKQHCRYCGRELPYGVNEYCDDECRKLGDILWEKELMQKKRKETNPLNIMIKRIEEYNRINSTEYTYGQFISLILPKLKGNQK